MILKFIVSRIQPDYLEIWLESVLFLLILLLLSINFSIAHEFAISLDEGHWYA
jgi:hypothetical protein